MKRSRCLGMVLTCSGHHGAQDTVDAGRIALSILLEPVINVPVQAGGNQYFGRPAELRQLLIGQRRDVRVVDTGIVSTLGYTSQDGLLPLIQRFFAIDIILTTNYRPLSARTE